MSIFFNLLLERIQLFAGSHPALAMLATGIAAVLLLVITCLRVSYVLREKAISLNTKRFQTLMDVLKAGNVAAVHPLRLELAFQRAFGRKQSSDEIVYALKHRNPSNLLFDMWHGRAYVKLDDERTKFVLKREYRINLRIRERIFDTILYLILSPAFVFSVVYAFLQPELGLVFVAEVMSFFWLMLTSARSLACAQRLLEGSHANDLRPSEAVLPPPPSSTIVSGGNVAELPKKRTRSKRVESSKDDETHSDGNQQ